METSILHKNNYTIQINVAQERSHIVHAMHNKTDLVDRECHIYQVLINKKVLI